MNCGIVTAFEDGPRHDLRRHPGHPGIVAWHKLDAAEDAKAERERAIFVEKLPRSTAVEWPSKIIIVGPGQEEPAN
jgi:hypothetical protein